MTVADSLGTANALKPGRNAGETIMKRNLAWLCVVGGLLVAGETAGRAPAPVPAGPTLDKATLAEVRKLQEKRRDLLREALAEREKLYQASRVEIREVVEASRRVLAAELELAATDAERIAAHQRHIEMGQWLVEIARARHQAARGIHADVLEAQAFSLEAKIGLLKAGGKLKKTDK